MASNHNNYVVIFKSVSESENGSKDIYYSTLHSAGFQVTLIPVLDFNFINLDQFLDKLKNPEEYTGIIFTSPRCVTGLKLAVESNPTVLEKWKFHKHLVVGEKTAESAENLGFFVEGKEAGNGSNLVEIISKNEYNKPFLYPMGSLTQKGFKSKLNENNVEVDQIMIYETKPHDGLESNLTKISLEISQKNKTIYFIYFSPSGITFSLPILRKLQVDYSNINFVAVGPTTEAAIIENGFKVYNTAVKPNPASVLDAILKVKS